MKKIILFLSLLLMLTGSATLMAQEKAKTQLTTVKQKGETVRVTLTSTKEFIFGSNRYVLYVGNKAFTQNEQSFKAGRGFMVFFIPVAEFRSLIDGSGMYLTYGDVDVEQTDMVELAKTSRKCWSLGRFNQSLLK